MKFTLLGCGHSGGTPTIGNFWGACDPLEPKNRRTRQSAMVQSATTTLIIDTGPDFKEQANRHNLTNIDAVLYTHAHSDHILGAEELRVFGQRHKKLIPIYADAVTMSEIKMRFNYLFVSGHAVYPRIIDPFILPDDRMGQKSIIGDIEFIPFFQDHGTCRSLGFRFGDTGYSTDMLDLDDAAINTLRGIDTWVVDAAAYTMVENPVHANLAKVYALNKEIGAKTVYITHLPPYMDYQTLHAELPAGYVPAYDGLVLDL